MRQISKQPVKLIPPDNVQMQWIDGVSGQLSAENCTNAQLMPFVDGSGPSELSECGASANGSQNWINNLNPF
jgi:penicillin-binding protein 1B